MRLRALCVLALATIPAAAQQRLLPDDPQPTGQVAHYDLSYRFAELMVEPKRERTVSPTFVVVIGVLGASAAADYITSSHWKPDQFETNPLLGPHPSDPKIAVFGASYFTGEVGFAYLLKRYGQRHSWAKYFWLVEPSAQAANHVRLAHHNTQLR